MFFDLIGAVCSLLSTYFFIRLNSKAWLVGIIATCLNGWLYWHKGIYADMMLEVFYFFSMGYGWYRWRGTADGHYNHPMLLNQLSSKQWLILFMLFGCTLIIIYSLLTSFTHSTVPFLDALTTTLSLLAQWLMCHKIIITWILWFITDVFYAVMYFYKHLPFHCLLMIVYTGMAVTGYVAWSRAARSDVSWVETQHISLN